MELGHRGALGVHAAPLVAADKLVGFVFAMLLLPGIMVDLVWEQAKTLNCVTCIPVKVWYCLQQYASKIIK